MKPDIYTFCTRRDAQCTPGFVWNEEPVTFLDLISTVQLFNMRFWNHVELKIIPEQHPATNKVR